MKSKSLLDLLLHYSNIEVGSEVTEIGKDLGIEAKIEESVNQIETGRRKKQEMAIAWAEKIIISEDRRISLTAKNRNTTMRGFDLFPPPIVCVCI